MKTIVLVALVASLALAQQYRASDYIPQPYLRNHDGQPYDNSGTQDENRCQEGTPEQIEKCNEEWSMQQEQEWQRQVEEQEALIVLGVVAIVVGVIVLAVHAFVLYFCLKKRSQRNRVKRAMMELQVRVANSQNMTLHQMTTHPDFPRTLHI